MGDSDAFDVFYRGTVQRLIRYAYGLTTDVAEAQDLVHEAYARAWQRWHRVSGYDDAESWLRLVVTRLATDNWRRLRVRREQAAARRPPPPVEPPGEDVLILVAALRTLPVPLRRALALHYLLDRSVADIATETGASIGTVKSWLSRGRSALAAALGPDLDEAQTGGSDAR
jgi:RNA polymerase sigma-70 factor (sigma-E family)